MPTVAVKGAIIVVSVAVAAAIAVYESPQARQFAEDLRRKIALALHALGDEVNPASNAQPRFNRPEDAEGFLQSGGVLSEPGVDADEESKKRQREELMYWNAIRMEELKKKDSEKGKALERPEARKRGSSFEDFLQEDRDAEKGTTFVLQSSAVEVGNAEGMRQRGGVRGLEQGAAWANPFGDEHDIGSSQESSLEVSEKYEVLSEGLYSASDSPHPQEKTQTRETTATIDELVDTSNAVPDPPISLPDINDHSAWNRPTSRNIPIQAPSPEVESAFASIHAWADQTNASFYSPLPTTPRALSPVQSTSPSSHQPQPLNLSLSDFSGAEVFDDPPESVPGDLTPTDSMSIIGAGDEGVWGHNGDDVMSVTNSSDFESVAENNEGINTPSSWSEVASVISEEDAIAH